MTSYGLVHMLARVPSIVTDSEHDYEPRGRLARQHVAYEALEAQRCRLLTAVGTSDRVMAVSVIEVELDNQHLDIVGHDLVDAERSIANASRGHGEVVYSCCHLGLKPYLQLGTVPLCIYVVEFCTPRDGATENTHFKRTRC